MIMMSLRLCWIIGRSSRILIGDYNKLVFVGETLLVRENYNLAASVPLTATSNWESRGTRPPCESRAAPSSPSGETSARSADTPCGGGYSVRSTATLRADAQSKRPKSAKGVWGKTRVFPHKQHIKSSRDYLPKQSGGLFRKHFTQLNSSLCGKLHFRYFSIIRSSSLPAALMDWLFRLSRQIFLVGTLSLRSSSISPSVG